MCGICGNLDVRSGEVRPGVVEPMLQAMVHRGPDAGGSFRAPGIEAGIRRLAVIDPAGGNQPIANEDGSVEVVFNGEIYNFAALRAELEGKGHRFRTRADTEVLVHLWEEHGERMLPRLHGMFAFCLHDRRTRRTLLARDRLGIKPLFYTTWDDGGLAFASELAVLLRHPRVAGEVDGEALVETFCLQYVAGDRTIYRGIRELPPGGSIEIRDGRLERRIWWRVPRGPVEPLPPGGLRGRCEELRALLEDAVAERTVADVPLGMFLSGGLDSSIVCALLSARSDHPVQTFSVGFEESAAHDEREHARRVADAFGAEHREIVVSAVDIADRLPVLIRHLAAPVADPALLPTWLLSEFARRHVTVALSGEGADELFAGYRRYLYQARWGWLGKVPASAALRRRLPRRIGQALEALREDRPARNHMLWSGTVGLALAGTLFDPECVERVATRVEEAFERHFVSGRAALADQLAADQSEWLPRNLLSKIDRATMAHSLEARVPFLDHRVVEWAARQPEELKLRGGATKFVLREAFRGVLPESTLRRPKRGFDLPLAQWIRGPLRSLAEETLSASATASWPQLRADRARGLLDEHLRGEQDHGLPLFLLVSVLLFLAERR